MDILLRLTIIFIHGRGGDRRLGMNDFSFGGNFNRLKNLANENGGTYYAPSIASFDEKGVAQTAALIDRSDGGRLHRHSLVVVLRAARS